MRENMSKMMSVLCLNLSLVRFSTDEEGTLSLVSTILRFNNSIDLILIRRTLKTDNRIVLSFSTLVQD